MNKYIFLDIDGVLNLESTRNEKIKIYQKEEYFMNDIYDVKSMLYLKLIINRTNAKIILTSNRRIESNCEDKFLANLLLYELDKQYIGQTPYLDNEIIKCPAIKKYITENNIKNYVILDDFEPNIQDQSLHPRFIPVNHKFGINHEIATSVIQILNNNTST